MLHEQDPTKGFCPFRMFFEQTPAVLQKKYRLYDTVAVPLYPSLEHREVSLKFALRSMGATEGRAGWKKWRKPSGLPFFGKNTPVANAEDRA